MPRIAICWSGQSRIQHLNDIENNQYDCWNRIWDLHQYLFQDFEVVDHFGHTWNDQALPPNVNDFKLIRQTDQNDILDWVIKEPSTRAQFTFSASQNKQQGVRNNTKLWQSATTKEKWDVMLEMQKPIWGQYWSFFDIAGEVSQYSGYDYIIKTRWDAYFLHEKLEEYQEQTRQELMNLMKNIIGQAYYQDIAYDFDRGTVYTANGIKTKFRSSFIPDFMFVIPNSENSRVQMHRLFHEGAEVTLSKAVSKIYNNYAAPWDSSGHGLWSDLFTNLGLSIRPGWTHPLQKYRTHREWHKYWETDYPNKKGEQND